VTDEGEPKELFELLCVGAVDFVTAPLRAREILPRVWRLLEKTRKFHRVAGSNDAERPEALRDLVGQSPMFRAEVEKIPTVARYDCGVLILGETGTGKELVARAIHEVHLRGVSDKARANAPSREQTTTLG
jgi:DNA-binding NtrC family response regulator